MDKKLFSLERDLENMGNLGDKRAILEMIKRKGKDKNMGFGPVKPIQIHSNIYKMAKNRIS